MILCLAATSTRKELAQKYIPPYILESYYFFQKWQYDLIDKCEFFILDSGAFTFMNNKSTTDFDSYLKKYASFIKDNKIKNFFELDVDSVVEGGYKKVKEYTQKLEDIVGTPCIPVWHKSRGIDEYYKMCEEYDYVAIGGIVTKEIKPSQHSHLKTLVKIAKQHNTKVHGLGFTPLDVKDYGFYSTDSTSWISGGRFGSAYFFNGKEMVQLPKPKNKRAKSYKEIDEHNLKEWIKFQNYLSKF